MGRNLKQSLEIPILMRELYIFTRKDLCFGTGRKSFAKYCQKLSVSARVSKSLAWTVFTCVKKMLSFGCVCCMKMGLKHVSPIPFDKKTVKFD